MCRAEDLRLNLIEWLFTKSNRIYTIWVGGQPIYDIFSLTWVAYYFYKQKFLQRTKTVNIGTKKQTLYAK